MRDFINLIETLCRIESLEEDSMSKIEPSLYNFDDEYLHHQGSMFDRSDIQKATDDRMTHPLSKYSLKRKLAAQKIERQRRNSRAIEQSPENGNA